MRRLPFVLRVRPFAPRRVAPWLVSAALALGGCGNEGGLDPQRPRIAVTPNPMVLLVEQPRAFAVTVREDVTVRGVTPWLLHGGGGAIGVAADQQIWAYLPGRDTVAVGVNAAGGASDTVAYVPVIGRGLRRPDRFPAYGDTVRLWFHPTGEARPDGYASPQVEDTVPVPQGVRWTVADPALVRVEVAAGDGGTSPRVVLTPLRAGRTTLTVEATANPAFRLQRPVTVGTCGSFNKFGTCVQVLAAP